MDSFKRRFQGSIPLRSLRAKNKDISGYQRFAKIVLPNINAEIFFELDLFP
jgi:hypothetical protein